MLHSVNCTGKSAVLSTNDVMVMNTRNMVTLIDNIAMISDCYKRVHGILYQLNSGIYVVCVRFEKIKARHYVCGTLAAIEIRGVCPTTKIKHSKHIKL